ncbi:DUF6928 family protein [Kitasatospora sp. NPDC092948]|uniref:DUF6928 family protein n=1 Tax=Kitasatospora sp. NPDC092948 TaxID=3364088 RepID=UPI0037F50A0A
MGFKTGLPMFADGEVPARLRQGGAADLGRTVAMMQRLTPGRTVEPTAPRLGHALHPPSGPAFAASFPGVDVVCDRQLPADRPSELPAPPVAASAGRRLVLHAMHSVADWSAFAVREDGRLVRSTSVYPDEGFIEDIGEPLPFEAPYRAEGLDMLPFRALALGVDALRALCGISLEDPPGPADVNDMVIELHGFLVRGPISG